MRSKTDYVIVQNDKGRATPQRVGTGAEQGKGIEYEFDMLIDISQEHIAQVLKDRTGKFQDQLIEKPDEKFGQALVNWLNDGETLPARKSFAETHSPAPESGAEAMLEEINESEKIINELGTQVINSGQVANFCIRQQELMISDEAVKKMLKEKGFSLSGSRREIINTKFLEAKKALEELGKKVNGNQKKLGAA
jgi:hypothetical protein